MRKLGVKKENEKVAEEEKEEKVAGITKGK